MKRFFTSIFAPLVLSLNAQAFPGPHDSLATRAPKPEIVNWRGEISDPPEEHTTLHSHHLRFKEEITGEVYDIVNSPELVKIHHETEKNYRLLIEGEITPRFLFWGGNLIVRNFKILKSTAHVPHIKAALSDRGFHEGGHP